MNFETLREANKRRLPAFTNSKGGAVYSKADGSDWSPAQWLQATIGELGEYANIRKKYERGDMPFEEYREKAMRELADVMTYLDILALRALDRIDGTPDPVGVLLEQAVQLKWNEVSERVGCPLRIYRNEVHDINIGMYKVF